MPNLGDAAAVYGPPVPKDVTKSTPADQCPRCADTGLIRQGFGRQPKPCGCWVGTPSTPKEAT
jgi:hypothetical protein